MDDINPIHLSLKRKIKKAKEKIPELEEDLKVLQALQIKSSFEELEENIDVDILHDSDKTIFDTNGGMIVEGAYYEVEKPQEKLLFIVIYFV